jgi:hypothetical protein
MTNPDANKKHDADAEIQKLQAEWSRTYHGLKRGGRRSFYGGLFLFIWSAWAAFQNYLEVRDTDLILPEWKMILWGLTTIICGVCFVRNGDPLRRIASVLTKIQQSDDVRLIGCALEADEVLGGKDDLHTVYLSLALLRLTPDDAPMMKPYLPYLTNYILLKSFAEETWTNTRRQRLARVALVALKNVGDSSVLPAVEKAAHRGFVTSDEQQFIKIAQDCLEHLRERAVHAHTAQTLLRPASDDSAHAESLLRPAHDAMSDARPQELLRVPDDAPPPVKLQ